MIKLVAWGNGEPCPFCQKMIPDKDHVNHLIEEHAEDLQFALFGKKEAEK